MTTPHDCIATMSRRHPPRAVQAVILTAGIGATVAQLVTTREFLAQFNGNEFVIALNLFVWLAAGGIGAQVAGSRSRKDSDRDAPRLAVLALVMAILPVMVVLAIRWLRERLFLPGSSVGFYPSLGFILLTVAPYGLTTGYLVTWGLGVLRRLQPETPAVRAYVLDNIGNVVGGALFAFVLVWLATPVTALVTAGLPLLAAALWLLRRCRWPLPVAGAVAVLGIMAGALAVEIPLLAPRQGQLIRYEETRFGRLAVFRDQGQVTLFRDGRPSASSQDPAGAEAAVHYPLSQCDHPRRVLLIGAQAGMLAELEKYRLATVDYVEIDPAAARIQFDTGLLRPIAPLRTVYQDARAFLAASARRYDAIIVSLPEPDTFQVNRYFTERFFRMAAAHLTSQGVLGFSVEGYANYLADAQRRKLSCLRRTAAQCFAHVQALPGERVHFLCRQVPIGLDIPERLAARRIDTLYAGPYFYGEIDAMRIADLETQFDPQAPVNTDTSPQLVRIMFDEWFERFATSPTAFALTLLAAAMIYVLRLSPAGYTLLTTGAMLMGGEILVVFAFQMVFGYIYQQLGLIVTAFLAGLLPGALWAQRGRHDPRHLLLAADAALILLLALFAGLLAGDTTELSAAVFAVFGLAMSAACGVQFPAAVRMGGDRLAAAAAAFGADLVGAAIGVLVVSVVLIPYLGLFGAAGALMVLKLTSLVRMGGCSCKT